MTDVAKESKPAAKPAAKPAIDEAELLRTDLTPLIRIVAFIARMLARCFTRVRAEGAIDAIPRDGAVILASNHVSNADAVIIGAWLTPRLGRRIHWLGKREMFDWPFVGWMARGGGVVPVDRGGADAEAFRLAQKVLGAGLVLVVFPEGTRSPTGELQRPKDGLAMLALRSNATIVPIGVSNTDRVWPKGRKIPQGRRPRDVAGRRAVSPRGRAAEGPRSQGPEGGRNGPDHAPHRRPARRTPPGPLRGRIVRVRYTTLTKWCMVQPWR